jgi:hypothetical protein
MDCVYDKEYQINDVFSRPERIHSVLSNNFVCDE